ncbi:homocysteine S-methyltransferase family protein [Candidatus Sumerlaeota bacterium]|nr:homocysteine S-methyltransferase family protein [Candidatus Sumerlaeota bacterium]
MPEPLLEALKTRVLLCDGGMGTQLQAAGLEVGGCGELWNVEHPERVKVIQSRYADAGSDLIITNTFCGSRISLANHGLAERAAELNEAAARLLREVAGPDRWVIGDIGPFGGLLAPMGEAEPEAVSEAFLEQARALLAGGADALIVETQTALEELELGVRAARQAIEEHGTGKKIPVIASMAYDKMKSGPPRTMMGVDPRTAATRMLELGVDIVACNCGTHLDIFDHAEIVAIYRGAAPDHPIMAQPNAGAPERTGTGIVYHETPEAMAKGVAALVDAGARIVGGCCGTTPEHIRLFRAEIDKINAAR